MRTNSPKTILQRASPLAASMLLACLVAPPQAEAVTLNEAHRGYSQIAPENTIAAINAAEGFADLTEFDVRVTSDGELVLMHDGTVDRTTNGSGSVSNMTLAQLQTLDAGSWFSSAFAGEEVATLTEAMNAAIAIDIEPLVERKTGSAATYNAEFIAGGFAPADFRVIAFDWNFLDSLDAINSDYQLGALGSSTITQSVINALVADGADFIDWNHGSIDQAAVDLVHANGMELHVWTVDSESRMEELIGFGIDGITTNNPELLSNVLNAVDPGVFGDLTGDDQITIADWVVQNIGRGTDLSHLNLAEAYLMGDLDEDRDNDFQDFQIFKELYERENGAGSFASLVAVPEPSSALLLIGVMLAFGVSRVASIARSVP